MTRIERWADRRAEIKKESQRVKEIVEHYDAAIRSVDDLKSLWEDNECHMSVTMSSSGTTR